MPDEIPLVRRLRSISECLLISMACLAPWAFGSVEAWAQFLLASGLLLVTALRLLTGWLSRTPRATRLLSVPGAAMAGIVILALLQSYALPGRLSGWIGPQIERTRAGLAPSGPQSLIDRGAGVVEPPDVAACLEPEATRHAAAQVAAVWILFHCAAGLGATYSGLRRFGLAIAVNATLLSLFSLIQALAWDGKIYGLRPSPISNRWYTGGPFVCHNHLAAYLNLGLGFGLGALMAALQPGASGSRGRDERGRFLWAAYAVAVILVGLIASHSRGGFLAMLAAGGVTFLVLRPRAVKLHLGLLAVALIVPIFLLAIGTDSPFQRLATISEAAESGLNGRASLWLSAIRAWAERPVLGAGLGNFEVAVSPALDRDLGVTFQHAENEYLEMAVEGGLAGLLLLLLVVGGVAATGYKALSAAGSARDRAWILGALFGMLALAVQSMGDFPLHIPGIAVTAVILAAFLFGLGKDPRRERGPDPGRALRGFRVPAVSDLVLCGLSVVIVAHEYGFARAEAAMAGAGFPMPGAAIPGSNPGPGDRRELEQARDGLRQALAFRPDSHDAHFRLGLVELKLYSLSAEEMLSPPDDEGADANQGASAEPGPRAEEGAEASLKADPLWLLGAVHSAEAGDMEGTGGLLAHAPIRDHLVPAARSLLEARRCGPFRAPVHAHLASVDYLLDQGEDARVHLERALRLAGSNAHVLALAGVVAVQVGALDLAAESWRRSLLTGIGDWREIADMAREVLGPDEILERVIPPGRSFEIWFADLLYTEPEDQEVRSRFLRASLERVAGNADLAPAERSWLQGQASARLDERDQARKHMQAALRLEPRRSPWRLEYVTWLLAWGQAKEAHTQARIGVELDPYHGGLRNALASAVDALARGSPEPGRRRPRADTAGAGKRSEFTTRLGTRR
ncbi:MAG: O-antigen ligase family protein [Isosphaeraceae bacterium]